MKKETIFKHELNESIQANAALNCLNNRNKHKQINEVAPVVATAGRMLLPMLRPVITKLVQKALVKIGAHARPTEVLKLVMGMLTKGEFAKKMAEKCGQTWNEIPSDVKKEIQNAIIDAFKAQSPQEQEENVDYGQLADDVCASYRGRLSKMDEKERVNFISTMVMKKIGKSIDTLTPQEKKEIISAAKHSMWYVSEQEEDTLNAYYSQDEPDYENDHHGIWLIINLMRKMGMLRAQGIEGRDDVDDGQAINVAYDLIEQKLNEEGMWIGDDDAEAERFVSFFGDEIAEEAMQSAIHNQQSQEQEENSLDTEYFSDLEEQEAYYENFRAIAELVANQIDKENGNDIDNNMDTLFEIVREVWNNNPDDLYIWDFDDVQEDACYKFFDKYYEIIKNEYLKREHNNIMAATHDDLFAY